MDELKYLTIQSWKKDDPDYIPQKYLAAFACKQCGILFWDDVRVRNGWRTCKECLKALKAQGENNDT